MKYLFLLRHAKSSWDYTVADWNRPLSERGIMDAELISQLLKKQKQHPELIVTSNAARAIHTASIFHKALNLPATSLLIAPELYMCSMRQFKKIIHQLPEDKDAIMLVSHNPLLTQFFNQVVDHGVDNIPTSGLAIMKFDIDTWSQVGNSADLLHFEYPKKYK